MKLSPCLHRRNFYSAALFLLIAGMSFPACAQKLVIPSVHSNMTAKGKKGIIQIQDAKFVSEDSEDRLGLSRVMGAFTGTESGLDVDFNMPGLNGTLYYGFIPYGDSRHPLPVYFKTPATITAGKTTIPIAGKLNGRYDMVGWEANEIGTFGYRVVDESGAFLYDGKVTFTGNGPFEVAPTVIEGPLLNQVGPDSAVISFRTNLSTSGAIQIGGQTFVSGSGTAHEIVVSGLAPATDHTYELTVGRWSNQYSLRTAPQPGSRSDFTFAYASDSRNGQGGGERNLYGANFYIVKKIMALAKQQDVAFFQFSGDMINGYLNDADEMNLQYANWKRAIEPFSHYFPVYPSMGNHEAFMRTFWDDDDRRISVDRFPYDTESGERIFADNFSNPQNGPTSEDGQYYDPNPDQQDFPSYSENVFWYRYDNVAVVVLNSNYWYAPSTGAIQAVGGNPHAYIMDGQIEWLGSTLAWMETDSSIDHIFVTQHTPAFPNGGHVSDDMWYRGNNNIRPFVDGKPVKQGILERRDTYLNLLVNESSKVRAIMTGDEHNYARTEVGPETDMYPEEWAMPKLTLNRTIWQVNNGAAGAPYYAQEETPWSNMVQGFTTQNALVLFDVSGKKISARVLNPDTLEEVDEFSLTD